MSKKALIVCIALAVGMATTLEQADAQTRIEIPNDWSGEFLGKGLLYSVSYQRMVSRSIGIEAGVEGLAAFHQIVIPIGGKFYFKSGETSPFAGAGVGVYPYASGDLAILDDAHHYVYVGVGVEKRSQTGFVIRAAAYGVFAGDEKLLWPGVSIGYAF